MSSSSDARIELILTVTELIAKYGIPAALRVLGTLNSDEPTIEEIVALRHKVRDPESYFS
jgi:hypothetical protein